MASAYPATIACGSVACWLMKGPLGPAPERGKISPPFESRLRGKGFKICEQQPCHSRPLLASCWGSVQPRLPCPTRCLIAEFLADKKVCTGAQGVGHDHGRHRIRRDVWGYDLSGTSAPGLVRGLGRWVVAGLGRGLLEMFSDCVFFFSEGLAWAVHATLGFPSGVSS